MEGYVDYVIQLDHEITREFERDALGIEVPYMSEEYEEWMISIDRKTPNAAKTYIYYIKNPFNRFCNNRKCFSIDLF